MLKRILAAAALAAGSSFTFGRIAPSVSLDASAPIGVVTADMFVDLAQTDTWTASALRAVAMNGAQFRYGRDDDPNSGHQDQLIGPYGSGAVTDQHVTCLSRPRPNRTSNDRFNSNAGAAIAGRYSPPGPFGTDVATADELNAIWYRSPPAGPTTGSVDGFIGRVSLDCLVPVGQTLGIGLTDAIPSGATIIMLSVGAPGRNERGFASATFDFPAVVQFDWAIWYVPEPGTALGLVFASAIAVLARRR